jgi:hypothetical protein
MSKAADQLSDSNRRIEELVAALEVNIPSSSTAASPPQRSSHAALTHHQTPSTRARRNVSQLLNRLSPSSGLDMAAAPRRTRGVEHLAMGRAFAACPGPDRPRQ